MQSVSQDSQHCVNVLVYAVCLCDIIYGLMCGQGMVYMMSRVSLPRLRFVKKHTRARAIHLSEL